MTRLEKSILKTLAFFDLNQRALELDEIWQFLYRTRASKIQVLIGLQNLEKNGKISKKNETYFLAGRGRVVVAEPEKEKLLVERWKKVERFSKIFRHLPFVQNVSVIGSLATGASSEGSDINLFIIARKHRTWLAKIFVMITLEIFGQNKNRWYRAGKFSVDYVLDEGDLDLAKRQFKKDNYSTYALANLTPVLDRGGYKKLLAANLWIQREFPNWQIKEVNSTSSCYTPLEKFILSKFGQAVWDLIKKLKRVKIWWDYFKNKSHEAEQKLIKYRIEVKRREYHHKWHKIVEKIVR